MITSSLTMEEVMSVYEKAKETEERKKGNREPGAAAGGASAARPGPSGDPAAAADIPEYTQEQKDYRHMREMLKTLSSAMDKPIWDNCTNLDAIVVKYLGAKIKDPETINSMKGIMQQCNASFLLQEPTISKLRQPKQRSPFLHKNPAEGTITAKKKVYELRHKNKLLELINDLSAAFLDEMINLRPIAHITASALRQRKYKDFLSPPPSRGKKLQLHCWHVFVPDYHHARGEIPDKYNAEVDNELVVPAKYHRNEIPDCSQNQLDNSVIEVDEFNIKDNTDFFEDVSFCHGHRNPLGTPINMKGQKYSDVWKEKAKYLKHQMVIEDVKKILKMVAQHFRDHIVRKKITESLPEINPARENEENVWVMTNDTKGVYLKLLKNENVVISHAFPDPVDPEDEDAHLDPPPPPPEPEEEEVIGKLKFTSYTSNKIRQYYTEYIEKKNAQEAEHPEHPYVFPHSEWTPGKPSKFTRQLRKMLEGGESVDPLSKRLTYDEEAEREEREIEEEIEYKREECEKQERDREEAERLECEIEEEIECKREEREKQERECEEPERAASTSTSTATVGSSTTTAPSSTTTSTTTAGASTTTASSMTTSTTIAGASTTTAPSSMITSTTTAGASTTTAPSSMITSTTIAGASTTTAPSSMITSTTTAGASTTTAPSSMITSTTTAGASTTTAPSSMTTSTTTAGASTTTAASSTTTSTTTAGASTTTAPSSMTKSTTTAGTSTTTASSTTTSTTTAGASTTTAPSSMTTSTTTAGASTTTASSTTTSTTTAGTSTTTAPSSMTTSTTTAPPLHQVQ